MISIPAKYPKLCHLPIFAANNSPANQLVFCRLQFWKSPHQPLHLTNFQHPFQLQNLKEGVNRRQKFGLIYG